MDLNKKLLTALAVLLTVAYFERPFAFQVKGLSLAASGVSIPGCGEGGP